MSPRTSLSTLVDFDLTTGSSSSRTPIRRHLSDMGRMYADHDAGAAP